VPWGAFRRIVWNGQTIKPTTLGGGHRPRAPLRHAASDTFSNSAWPV